MNVSTSLLFLHGHIVDPGLAVSLAAAPAARAPHLTSRSPAMDLFKSLMYLGGRPMHAGHNYDLEEPFEPTFGNRVASERLFGKDTLTREVPTREAPLRRRQSRQRQPRAVEGLAQGCG
jgi:hypothetical protein